ncbi:MAG: hypothetical protein ACE5O2_11335, partial [Armatimonadota bacterium]
VVWASYARHVARWRDNPFLLRELYVASRKPAPLRGVGFVALLLTSLFAITLIIGVQRVPSGISPAWGGALGALVMIPLSILHYILISVAVSGRTGDWIAQEAGRGTLGLLLVTPMSPTEMVLKRAVPPLLAAGVVMALPLPLYVLCVSMGGVSFDVVAALYLMFGLAAFLHSGPQRTSLIEQAPRPNGSSGDVGAGGRTSSRHSGWSSLIGIMWFMFLCFGVMRGRFTNPLAILVLAARALVSPHAFFGVRLHPVVPLLCLTPLLTTVTVAWWARRLAVHGADRPPASERLETIFRVLLVFVALGYGWPYLVTAGYASRLVGVPGLVGELRGVLLVLLGMTAIVTGVELVVGRFPSLGLLTLVGYRPAPKAGLGRVFGLGCLNALSALVAPAAVFAAASGLLGVNPLLVSVAFGGKALAASGGAILFSFGLGTLLSALWRSPDPSWRIVIGVLFYGGLLCGPLLGPDAFGSPQTASALASLSPIGGLADLADFRHVVSSVPWLHATLVHVVLFVLCSLTGLWIWAARRPAADQEPSPARPTPLQPPARRVSPPLTQTWDRRCLRIQRFWDNPVLVRGVRLGYRKDQWHVLLVLFGLAFLGFCVILFLWPPAVTDFVASLGIFEYVADPRLGPLRAAAAAVTPIVMGAVGILAWLIPAINASDFLCRERRNGTFAFTMMTPLSPAEIVLGGAGVALYPIALLLCVAAVPCVISTGIAFVARAALVLITSVIWIVMLAVTGGGLALGISAMWRFRGRASGNATALAVAFLGAMEVVRMVVSIGMANALGTGFWLHFVHWGLMGVEILVGLQGYLLAYRTLARMRSSDLPTEEHRPAPQSV